jgi:hypothetical protein
MKSFKLRYVFILVFITNFLYCQENKIAAILNKQLSYEVKIQLKHPDFLGDTIFILQPFTIDNNKILSLIIKRSTSNNGYIIEKQEVALDKIKSFGKDINVFFETEEGAVSITNKTFNKDTNDEISTQNFHLFFTHIHLQKRNDYLGNKIKSAFKKAGYNIDVNYWYN